MPKTAFITGSGFSLKFLRGFDQKIVKTMFGNVLLLKKGKIIFLQRHGKNKNIPPHKVNHKANICALNMEGVEKIFAINSVGSLKETIKQGTVIIPNDYISFAPESFLEFELRVMVPELDEKLIKELKQASKKAKITTKNTGNYIQTRGPRLETKAEVNILKKFGQIVGMTLATEATLAQELGLPYAAVCSVDNFANGILKRKITEEQILKNQTKNQKKIEKIVKELINKNK